MKFNKEVFQKKAKEPSTWAGLVVILAAFGVPVPPGIVEQVALVAAGAVGLYEVVRSEKEVE